MQRHKNLLQRVYSSRRGTGCVILIMGTSGSTRCARHRLLLERQKHVPSPLRRRSRQHGADGARRGGLLGVRPVTWQWPGCRPGPRAGHGHQSQDHDHQDLLGHGEVWSY
ncbi:hypothetical protein D1007_38844 [Hordeum vulgare]|nr:hypothetical protein D1007_38844 [Hordeum vulgare]